MIPIIPESLVWTGIGLFALVLVAWWLSDGQYEAGASVLLTGGRSGGWAPVVLVAGLGFLFLAVFLAL